MSPRQQHASYKRSFAEVGETPRSTPPPIPLVGEARYYADWQQWARQTSETPVSTSAPRQTDTSERPVTVVRIAPCSGEDQIRAVPMGYDPRQAARPIGILRAPPAAVRLPSSAPASAQPRRASLPTAAVPNNTRTRTAEQTTQSALTVATMDQPTAPKRSRRMVSMTDPYGRQYQFDPMWYFFQRAQTVERAMANLRESTYIATTELQGLARAIHAHADGPV
ncbi:hypothetical protein L596_012789 [Steinernema carpocapsae]|uniref:Uncharacterized protein n=1 Tax=Steinernema carpocapsae TaxID=34508 RepID=A0A4V6XWF6_STECR|nr:hypothetical protein L596_012789 [Steinernema carpocapsae]